MSLFTPPICLYVSARQLLQCFDALNFINSRTLRICLTGGRNIQYSLKISFMSGLMYEFQGVRPNEVAQSS